MYIQFNIIQDNRKEGMRMNKIIIDMGNYRIVKETSARYRVYDGDHVHRQGKGYTNWFTVCPTLESAFEWIEERKAE